MILISVGWRLLIKQCRRVWGLTGTPVSRYIVVRLKNGEERRIDITGCPWCTDTAVCSACCAEADEIRKRESQE